MTYLAEECSKEAPKYILDRGSNKAHLLWEVDTQFS